MRFGLVGTGFWAEAAHAAGLRATEGAELTGVWGRDPAKAAALGERLGVKGFDDFDALLETCDAVAFAVPPDVQAPLAVRAADAGKHLLLDKPVALTAQAAAEVATAAERAGVASVVFFTDRFAPESRAWLADTAATPGWHGGWVRALAALDAPGNPFGGSPWRRERGALWDIGPHALSTLTAALGPITTVTAVAGTGDLTHLVVTHKSGATSTATLTLFAPIAGSSFETGVWGESGTRLIPPRETPAAQSLAIAAAELISAAATGEPHSCDAAFGAHIVALLEDAQRQKDSLLS